MQFDTKVTLGNILTALTVAGSMVGVYTKFNVDLAVVQQAVASSGVVSEIKQSGLESRLERIEQKVDRLIERRR